MSERPQPDLDQVREAMREHDERSEDPPEHVAPPEPEREEPEEDAGAP